MLGTSDLTSGPKMVMTNRQRFETDKLRSQITMETEQVDKVLVIGAGVTGLALAQGLRKRGVGCVVYERSEGGFEMRRN